MIDIRKTAELDMYKKSEKKKEWELGSSVGRAPNVQSEGPRSHLVAVPRHSRTCDSTQGVSSITYMSAARSGCVSALPYTESVCTYGSDISLWSLRSQVHWRNRSLQLEKPINSGLLEFEEIQYTALFTFGRKKLEGQYGHPGDGLSKFHGLFHFTGEVFHCQRCQWAQVIFLRLFVGICMYCWISCNNRFWIVSPSSVSMENHGFFKFKGFNGWASNRLVTMQGVRADG